MNTFAAGFNIGIFNGLCRNFFGFSPMLTMPTFCNPFMSYNPFFSPFATTPFTPLTPFTPFTPCGCVTPYSFGFCLGFNSGNIWNYNTYRPQPFMNITNSYATAPTYFKQTETQNVEDFEASDKRKKETKKVKDTKSSNKSQKVTTNININASRTENTPENKTETVGLDTFESTISKTKEPEKQEKTTSQVRVLQKTSPGLNTTAQNTSMKISTKGNNTYNNLIIKYANEYNLDPNLIKAVIAQESDFNPNARGTSGEIGLMQLMPGTANDLGVIDRSNPEQNIAGGAKYLRQLLNRYKNNLDKALSAYNAGMGNVDKGNYELTYANSVKSRYNEFKQSA